MIRISGEVYKAICEAFRTHTPECGGVLGAVPGKIISHFYFDESGTGTAWAYSPDCDSINAVLKTQWAPLGVQMVGLIHSHSNAGNFPSCGDLHYCEQIMKAAQLDEFLLPIITLNPFRLHVYVAELKTGRISVRQEELMII